MSENVIKCIKMSRMAKTEWVFVLGSQNMFTVCVQFCLMLGVLPSMVIVLICLTCVFFPIVFKPCPCSLSCQIAFVALLYRSCLVCLTTLSARPVCIFWTLDFACSQDSVFFDYPNCLCGRSFLLLYSLVHMEMKTFYFFVLKKVFRKHCIVSRNVCVHMKPLKML